jgi:hypothetical protein
VLSVVDLLCHDPFILLDQNKLKSLGYEATLISCKSGQNTMLFEVDTSIAVYPPCLQSRLPQGQRITDHGTCPQAKQRGETGYILYELWLNG